MFRTAILRSSAAVSRTAMRPVAVRKLAIATPRVSSFVPKTIAWQGVRCYSSAGSLEKAEVYSRIKQLLQGFDKVRLGRFDGWVSGSLEACIVVLSLCFNGGRITRSAGTLFIYELDNMANLTPIIGQRP